MRWAQRNMLDAEDADLLDSVLLAMADFDLKWFIEKQREAPRK